MYSDRDLCPIPVVMLLDLQGSKQDGFTAFDQIRSHSYLKHLPVIVLAAYTQQTDVQRAFQLGATAFLIKPGTQDEILALMGCLRDWLKVCQFPSLEIPTNGFGTNQLSFLELPTFNAGFSTS